MGNFHVRGPHPQSWGSSDVPPGAPVPVGWQPADSGNDSGSESSPVFSSGHCAGLYPVTGNSTYYDNCVGHDEPGIQFYSNLPGSSGNWTWNVTLPTDRGPSENQSNLYVAVWFGMTLTDPLAWMNQCFLELQLYPDSTFGGPPAVTGAWVGAAVAWQIEAATGYEDPCYYSPLYNGGIPGPGYFNMTQGDRLSVTANGWAGDRAGENITVRDLTSGLASNISLVDPYGNFPLDPSYSTNSYENGLQWTPGGEYPTVFAFETGHGRDPDYPSNTTFNYCDPGRPPSTVANPYVPCPSYDPASWANDSLQPWRIGVPTFGSGATTTKPAQVGFTQDLGGIALDEYSPGCPGNEGSAYCSYPWYSYSCATDTFQFGATDYAGVTSDFGKYGQYATVSELNNLGFGYYPPTNFSIPSCGRPGANVGVSVSGGVGGELQVLSAFYAGPGTVAGLSDGEYSIHAIGGPGEGFAGWSVRGNVTIDLPTSAWATLTVRGNGSVTATFAASPPQTSVTFLDSGGNGSVAVFPSYLLTGTGTPIATLASGGVLALASQIYAIEALPPPGENFTGWSSSGPAAVVAAPGFPDSWFVVTGAAPNVTVTATYAAVTVQAIVSVFAQGSGTVDLGNSSGTSYLVVLSVGTYGLSAIPAAGWQFSYWYSYGSLLLPDSASSTNVSLENGSTSLTAVFVLAPVAVTFDTNPSTAGWVSLSPPTPILGGTTESLAPGYYSLAAAPPNAWVFDHWIVNSSAAAWVTPSRGVSALLEVNASATVTAWFVPANASDTIFFHVAPAAAGSIDFNFWLKGDGSSNVSLANGTYYVAFEANPGYAFATVQTTGPLSLAGTILTLSGTGGNLYANFTALPAVDYAVTFVSGPVNATVAALNGTGLRTGDTLWLPAGAYALAGTTIGTDTFTGWSTAGHVRTASNTGNRTTLNVTGGGTVYASAAEFRVSNVSVGPSPSDLGLTVAQYAVATGFTSPYNYTWSSNAPGCRGPTNVPVNTLYCTPTATGTYSFSLNVSDVAGENLVQPNLTLVVAALPGLTSFTANRTTFDQGTSARLTVVAGGGVPPLTFQYTNLPPGCRGPNASSFVCTPTSPGNFTVHVQVHDVFGPSVGADLLLAVAAPPTIDAFSASPGPLTVGAGTTFTATVGGGTGPFSFAYSGLPTGCLSTNGSTLSCRPMETGTFDVQIGVSDADGLVALDHAELVVNPAPSVTSFTASPGALTLGNSSTLSVSATGGTPPLRYAYTALPPGCGSANRSLIACAPNASGSYSIVVTVTDVFGANASASVALRVSSLTPGNPTTTLGGGPPILGELVLVGIAVVLVAAVIAFLLRRRRPTPTAPATGPPTAEGPANPGGDSGS